MKILMNSAMMPREGSYILKKVSKEEFIKRWKQCDEEMRSSIGYYNVANNLSHWLGEEIPVNRSQTTVRDDDTIFVCKLQYRLRKPSMKKKYTPKPSDYEFYIANYKSLKK